MLRYNIATSIAPLMNSPTTSAIYGGKTLQQLQGGSREKHLFPITRVVRRWYEECVDGKQSVDYNYCHEAPLLADPEGLLQLFEAKGDADYTYLGRVGPCGYCLWSGVIVRVFDPGVMPVVRTALKGLPFAVLGMRAPRTCAQYLTRDVVVLANQPFDKVMHRTAVQQVIQTQLMAEGLPREVGIAIDGHTRGDVVLETSNFTSEGVARLGISPVECWEARKVQLRTYKRLSHVAWALANS